MVFLAEFSVFSPDFGLFFWTLAIFLVFFVLLSKFAFKPIAQALKDREDSIKDALASADRAKAEMANLKSENEALLSKAKEERALMLKEAKENASTIVADAKNAAKEEANKIMTNAKLEIDNMKQSALTEVKNQVGMMALDIAEKVIKKDLKGNVEQVTFVNTLAKEMNLN
jgi:F-type H+-transporting ATPase subunit b